MGRRQRTDKFYKALADELLAYGEHWFRNARTLPDGAAEGDHRSSAARQWAALGKKSLAAKVAPAAPPLSPCARYLWSWFGEITYGNLITGMAPSVLTWEGLWSWCNLMQIRLEPWEATCLMRLSILRANIDSESTDAGSGKNRSD